VSHAVRHCPDKAGHVGPRGRPRRTAAGPSTRLPAGAPGSAIATDDARVDAAGTAQKLAWIVPRVHRLAHLSLLLLSFGITYPTGRIKLTGPNFYIKIVIYVTPNYYGKIIIEILI
jgi:hypothetical protein